MSDAHKKQGLPPVVKVLLILGISFGLLVMLGIGTCTYVFMSNPELRKAGSLIGETMRMGIAATKAPGTAELREAGCDEAMVMDMRRIVKLIQEMEEAKARENGETGGDADAPPEELQMPIVMCQLNSADTELDCPSIAAVYGGAIDDPPKEFILTMQARFSQKPICQGVFAPDGSKIGEVDEEQMRGLAGGGQAVPIFEAGDMQEVEAELEALERELEAAEAEEGSEPEAEEDSGGDEAGGW